MTGRRPKRCGVHGESDPKLARQRDAWHQTAIWNEARGNDVGKLFHKERKRRKAWRASARDAGICTVALQKRVAELEAALRRQYMLSDWCAICGVHRSNDHAVGCTLPTAALAGQEKTGQPQ